MKWGLLMFPATWQRTNRSVVYVANIQRCHAFRTADATVSARDNPAVRSAALRARDRGNVTRRDASQPAQARRPKEIRRAAKCELQIKAPCADAHQSLRFLKGLIAAAALPHGCPNSLRHLEKTLCHLTFCGPGGTSSVTRQCDLRASDDARAHVMEAISKHGDVPTTRDEALERRVKYYQRVFARGVGRSPTSLQRLAIARAARLSAIAEAVASNPNTTINDLVRADGSAARARADMAKVLQAKPAKQLGPDSLRAYLASKQAASA